MNNKEYLFNPFEIKKLDEFKLQSMYENTFKSLKEEPNTMFDYSHNIEVYANLNYIIGEIIARLTKDVSGLKSKIEVDIAINTTEERKAWNQENGKPPAMSYFEGIATRMSKSDIDKLADKECSLRRFKNAYQSLEEKINALKKKQESIKYEEFN